MSTNLFYRIPGRAYLLVAIGIFAAANSVIRKLTELGAQNLIDGRNPISFCNVLFVGNLCALIALILIYGKQWNVQSLKQLSVTDWLGLTGVAILSGALAPALIFIALEQTMVNNVVLIIGVFRKIDQTIPPPQLSSGKEMDMEVGFKGI